MAKDQVSLPTAFHVEHIATVDSTQDAMRRVIDTGREAHGLVIRARAQTKGRGRLRHAWSSELGGSYQTVALADESGLYRSGRVPLAIAVGIASSFAHRGVELRLKWPNDIFRRTAKQGDAAGKLGGILCERTRGYLLVGVGMNVRNPLPPGSGSLTEFEPDEVSEIVVAGIALGLGRFLTSANLPAAFERYDMLAGRCVRIEEGGRLLVGTVLGISDGGCLSLELAEGRYESCGGRIIEVDAAAS